MRKDVVAYALVAVAGLIVLGVCYVFFQAQADYDQGKRDGTMAAIAYHASFPKTQQDADVDRVAETVVKAKPIEHRGSSYVRGYREGWATEVKRLYATSPVSR